ncbi:MAG: hypothetical protein WC843_04935 [Candidatus Gracilibacteria bacterium]|jgi:hypothetical protein
MGKIKYLQFGSNITFLPARTIFQVGPDQQKNINVLPSAATEKPAEEGLMAADESYQKAKFNALDLLEKPATSPKIEEARQEAKGSLDEILAKEEKYLSKEAVAANLGKINSIIEQYGKLLN